MNALRDLRLVISQLPGELRSAWIDQDGRLVDLAIARGDRPQLVGSLFFGRVRRLDRALEAAFVDLGAAGQGFLPLARAPARLSEGDGLLLVATRDAAGDKGPRLSARLTHAQNQVAERFPKPEKPGRLIAGDDPLVLLLTGQRPAEVHIDDGALFETWSRTLGGEVEVIRDDPPAGLFASHGLETQIAALQAREISLEGGGRLLIEPGETLTAIDVDSGARQEAGSARLAEQVNGTALPEIARALRLRSLSGLIVIDFLGLQVAGKRRALVAELKALTKDDPAETSVGPMSPSGLVEVHRQRLRPPLHELLFAAPARIRHPVALAYEALHELRSHAARGALKRPRIYAGPDVLDALAGPVHAALKALTARLGVMIQVELCEDREGYEIVLD